MRRPVLRDQQVNCAFSIIGTQYGGNGTTHFNLPDLRSRVPIHVKAPNPIGHTAGAETVGLDGSQMPQQTHFMQAGTGDINSGNPDDNILATGAAGDIQAHAPPGAATVDMVEHALEETGGGENHANIQPYLAMEYVICYNGYYPASPEEAEQGEQRAEAGAPVSYGATAESEAAVGSISDSYMGESRIFPYKFAPRDWATCDGQLLTISAFQGLYSLIGTTYGGDGATTFALPDLRGRVAIHMGQGKGLSNRALASSGGADSVALDPMAIPSHDHRLQGRSAAPTPNNDGTLGIAQIYRIKDKSNPILAELDLSSIDATPPQPATAHENRQPFVTVNFIIALAGIYPSKT